MSRFNRFLRRASRLLAVSTIGAVLVAVGVALSLPGVPGPGLLLVIAGLAVLAKEFDWAHRLMAKAKAKAEQLKDRALDRDGEGAADGSDEQRSTRQSASSEDEEGARPHEPAA